MYRCNIYQTLGLVEGVEASWASFQQRFNHQGIEIYKALSVITAGDYCKGFKCANLWCLMHVEPKLP